MKLTHLRCARLRHTRERLPHFIFIANVALTLCLLLRIGSASAHDLLQRQITLEISAGTSLESALLVWAHEAQVQIMMSTDTVSSIACPAIRQTASARTLLETLLKGTGLSYTLDQDTLHVIRLASSPSTPAPPSLPSPRKRSGATSTSITHLSGPKNTPSASNASDLPTDPRTVSTRSTESTPNTIDPPPRSLEEIVVTAEKVKEREIDAPLSMTVLSASELSNIGASQFSDFAGMVPGLSFTTAGAGFTQVSLRGVTTGADVSSTVGIYIDDVPIGSSTGFAQGAQLALDLGLFDIERLDVLRGPQGTLYGANSMGGLLKYVTYEPNSTEYSEYVQAGVSDTQNGGVGYKATSTINLPLVQNAVALRATGFELHDGGYIDNRTLGDLNVNHSDISGGRIDLLISPTSVLSARISGILQDITRHGLATADFTLNGAPLMGSLQQEDPLNQPFSQRFRLVSGVLTYTLPVAVLTSISSYQTIHSSVLYDYSRVFVPEFSAFGLDYSAVGDVQSLETSKFTQELRVASTGTRTVRWILGGFYDRENSSNYQAFVLKDLAGQPAANNLYTVYSPSSYKEYAGFGDVTLRVSERASVTGGIRDSHNSQSYGQNGSGLLIGSQPTSFSSASVTTYLANARYRISKDGIAYVRYATGYRPGGPNFVVRDPVTGQLVAPLTFKADRLSSYEIGTKEELDDRRVTLDADGYDVEWHNIQVLTSKDGFAVYANAAGARIQGAELTLALNPIRSLNITGSLAYQHAYLTGAAPDLGGSEGERLPNVPRYSASASAEYEFPLGTLPSSVGANLSHVSDRTTSFANSSFPNYRLPAYTRIDVHGAVSFGRVVARLYVDNLFNTRGQLSAFLYTATAAGSGDIPVAILQPRTVGLDFSANF